MTNWIYFDNFRGFQATLIPLASVNFLVGENSTGKTSVLSLIALLGEPRFWFEQDFNCGAINLGRYRDIASTGAGVKGRFRIGYVTPVAADQDQPAEQYEAVLMTFEEIDNNPLISHFAYAGQSGVITVEFNGKQTRYHYDQPDQESWTEQRALGLFAQWIANSVESKSDQTLEREETLNRRLALTAVNRLVQRLYDESMGVDESNRTVAHAPAFASNIAWLAPIRSKPRRTYDEYKADFDPEGEHTPYLIRRLLRQGKASAEFRRFIERFGQESGLFDTLEIKGFGKEAASPFELRVVLDDLHIALVNVGYGVAQALPVVVEMFARRRGAAFAIQQPEVHLHPKAQAALGDVIYRLAVSEQKQFYIETHSDYLIDRFRLNYRTASDNVSPAAQVLFFGRNAKGNYVVPIAIGADGEYAEDQPGAFREFFIHEQLRLLGL